ncbi:MAG: hypothetical protein ABJC98_04140, partial [Bacteroidota bacterium]
KLRAANDKTFISVDYYNCRNFFYCPFLKTSINLMCLAENSWTNKNAQRDDGAVPYPRVQLP